MKFIELAKIYWPKGPTDCYCWYGIRRFDNTDVLAT